MRIRDSSAQALKIWDPRVRLKLFSRISHLLKGRPKVHNIRHFTGLSLYLKRQQNSNKLNGFGRQWIFVLTVVLLVAGLENVVFAQERPQKKRVIQLSGVVIGDDSTSVSGLPGVHIYVPKAGRGTTSNHVGFFSLPVLIGDSIVVSSVGFERQHFIVPEDAPEYQTIVITMVSDATLLSEITVLDFPTEEVFKEAVLAMNIPLESGIDDRNLNQELLALMLKTTPMDGYQNQRYYLSQWANSSTDRFQPVTNPFLNPFNWAKFFKSLKDNKKK